MKRTRGLSEAKHRFASSLLFVLLSFSVVAATNSLPAPVFHSSLRSATEAAASDQSLVLIIFGAAWCGPCKMLKAKTLESKEFLEQGGALHAVEIDIDSEKTLARDYQIEAVPTLVLQTPENKIVMRKTGFVYTAELLLWVKEARERVKQGKWEGTVPTSKLAPFVKKAADDQLTTNDVAQLMKMLEDPDPANRQAVSKLLLEQREQVVLPLIASITNAYLGTRIAASDLLTKLAPDAVNIDPWQSPVELFETVTALNKWWAQTGKLPPPAATPKLDPAAAANIKTTIDTLRRGDPIDRTEAMSSLVSAGEAALPEVRQGIKSCEQTGDQRSLALLEDVRWAILVPESLEERAGAVRTALARGKGAERQAAAIRLGKAGHFAIPALAELANDADPLVVESAVRSLSQIGGADALPAMAALLKAADSNLRMTAAQALGHTKDSAAIKFVLTVTDDPNEVVACTALSALEEINGDRDYSPSKKSQPSEVIKTLKTSLADPRWRVRSTAAEVTGKLDAKELTEDVKPLLDDQDGFVVKSALEALRKLGATPEPDKLMAVAKKHTGLRGEAVEMLVSFGHDEAVKAVTETYKSSSVEGKVEILRSLHGNGVAAQYSDNSPWQSLLGQAIAEPEPRIRLAAADALLGQPQAVAASLLSPLLLDDDPATRAKAVTVLLSIISGERAYASHNAHGGPAEWMFVPGYNEGFPQGRQAKTNTFAATPDQIALWHTNLLQKASSSPTLSADSGGIELLTAAAIYVTGNSNTDLPLLRATIERADKSALAKLCKTPALSAILPRLPWPDGQPVVEKLSASPQTFLRLLAYSQKAVPALRDFLHEPARFRAAVEPAAPDELADSMPQLLTPNQSQWSLVSADSKVDAILTALVDSTNPVWRAAAIYCLGSRSDPHSLPLFERATKDSNAWVRATAILGLAKTAKDRATLETSIGPLLSDPDTNAFNIAALALLEPETRTVAGVDYQFDSFHFDKIHAWSSAYRDASNQRPLTALDSKPAFLDQVRQRLAGADDNELWVPALLLAQYGDFTGLDRMLQNAPTDKPSHGYDELGNVLPTIISMSRDAKYLPPIKKMAAAAKDNSDYVKILQAIKGMPGPEARELRLEINKRMRQSSQ